MNYESWEDYEGLVKGTIEHWGLPPGQEYEDVQQILRMKVVEALQKYDPSKGLARKNFVFGCVVNRMRDLHRKKVVPEVSWEAITDEQPGQETTRVSHLERKLGLEVTEGEVYGHVWDDDPFDLPSTLTERERVMAEGLMEGATPGEIMEEHNMTRQQWMQGLRSLKTKMADWAPPDNQEPGQISPDDDLRELMEEAPNGK